MRSSWKGKQCAGVLLGNLLPSGQGLEWHGEEPWLLKTNQHQSQSGGPPW